MKRPLASACSLLAFLFALAPASAVEWSFYDGAYHKMESDSSQAFPSDAYPSDNDQDPFDPGAKNDAEAMQAYSPIAPQVVEFQGHAPGEIVIHTSQKRLYFVLPDGQTAIVYGIGVGREGFAWTGTQNISRKREWPDWTPPTEMLERRPDLPVHMLGGLNNPLGARALYLGSTLYRIHGTNEPMTIGHEVSSGCIRLANHDIIDLFNRVSVGAKVTVEK